jgi:molybdate transport system ATP-binding protein
VLVEKEPPPCRATPRPSKSPSAKSGEGTKRAFDQDDPSEIPANQSILVSGESGAGKTVTLEIIAGLRTPGAGAIRLGGRTLSDAAAGVNLPPRERRVGYVPQDVALFPHLPVRKNLLYGVPAGAMAGTP